MASDSEMTPRFAMLYDLLDRDESEFPAVLVNSMRRASRSLVPLAISLGARDGLPLGPGSADELRRARGRVATYRRISGICRDLGARTVKGPSLAALYPDDLVRSSNDLDLVVPDESTLWTVVARVLELCPATDSSVTVIEGPAPHLLVTLYWQAEDVFLDSEMRVEVTTFAYLGDVDSGVPLRPALPADQVAADLMALAEERFQRSFHAKDMFDIALLLATVPAAEVESLLAVARDYLLAPEIAELLCKACAHLTVPDAVERLLPRFEDLARAERARRAAAPRPPEGWLDDRHRTPVYGFQLGPLRAEPGLATSRRLDFAEGSVLRTAIGDFLLVPDTSVQLDLYEQAVAALAAAEEA
jgi:hypothetical protein